jgi:ATF/CREB family transcription factor
MFPAPSPNSQALFAQLASSGATPGTIDFHRTALSAAAAKREQQTLVPQAVTSQPQDMANGNLNIKPEGKASTGPFDPHDNDAANGLFMLAQGRNGAQPANNNNFAVQPPQQTAPKSNARAPRQPSTSPQMNGNISIAASSTRGISEAASAMSDESEQQVRPTTRGRGKRNSTANGATTNGRRKAADDAPKPPAKKSRTNGGGSISSAGDMDMMDHSDDENMNMKDENGNPKPKMTDEEKRKNFLERNRYA